MVLEQIDGRRFTRRFEHRNLRGATVMVIGMARTGQAITDFLLQQGARVIAADTDHSKQGSLEERYKGQPVQFLLGPHQATEKLDLIILSPGVPCTGDFFDWVETNHIPVLGELELASRFLKRPIIAVTGTNGKTTITGMISHILVRSGYVGETAGNIGKPLASLVTEGRAESPEPLVLEVSSFQLETIQYFRPRVAIICNLAPDHLDRYATVQDYYETKSLISSNQTQEDCLWIGPGVAELCYPLTEAVIQHFGIGEHSEEGLYEIHDTVHQRIGDFIESMKIPWWKGTLIQTRLNAMAAVGAANSLGIPAFAGFNALQDYRPPRHRLEFIASVHDIACYNDSKATNVHAVCAALQSVPAPIFLIAGGRYKGDPLDPLVPLIREKVRHIYLLGESAIDFAHALSPFTEITIVRNMQEAVQRALTEQIGPATLLLSPACASWDMYQNYEQRGDDFAKAVREVAG
ncbi:MAG TPA: UDP-N-acetylmuramoyl-L-alanine--D-glutamate ligase [bacterium]|nr:UDP-N-acetylmuramoyl-L-alanine--D-glutamate ligase [bacterium]HQO33399.1 UDP-N-acetylmuramoyl-L-alanine--D-glutamate ligase [bacterium]HQP98634.1 UDP-N-acetylmuramoyl-L-alanine--D-glutamate ligase [bacterium]